ncbi:MAG: MFS transporter [Gammaproteobacteria bacterium]|nr:MFS transporter [Gammaproteobacteria bacterium]
MLGLFMILPVFALYASERFGTVAPVLIGLAIGAYGLSQAVLQVPFGMLSDRFGCKPVIAVGLVIFALGSVVAATADSMTGIIIGRMVQGSGAIAAAVMALAADLTREEHRTKAMAVIGLSIGLSFAVSLALGPILNHWIGVPGIFWLTAVLALLGIALLYLVVPDPVRHRTHRDTGAVPGYFSQVLRDPQLLRIDGGIFALHCILTASFVALPFALRDFAGVETAHHGYVYLPVLLVALVVMVPLVVVAEKRRRLKEVFLSAIAGVALAELGLAFFHVSLVAIVALLLLFFCAFNVLEALLPSLIAKFAPADKKGTAMGVYSTSQFLGAFCGGVVGGYLYGHAGIAGVFGFCALMAALWWLWARSMAPPRYLSSYMISLGESRPDGAGAEAARRERELLALPGVAEAIVVMEEGVAYLKVDSRAVDYGRLDRLAAEWAGTANS